MDFARVCLWERWLWHNVNGLKSLYSLPTPALRATQTVLWFGEKKYGSPWTPEQDLTRAMGAAACCGNKPVSASLSLHAEKAIGHITRWQAGADLEQESGKHHLAHAAARVLMQLQSTIMLDRRHYEGRRIALPVASSFYELMAPGFDESSCAQPFMQQVAALESALPAFKGVSGAARTAVIAKALRTATGGH